MIRTKLALGGLLLALVVATGLTATAYANRADGTSSVRVVSKEQTVNGPYFAAGQQINIDGQVDGDVYCAGQNVTITGRVDGDVLCASQNLSISGTVTGDVRSLSQTTTLSGTVEGSLSAAAETVSLQSGSRVGRDVAAAASYVAAAGAIDRDLWTAGRSLEVSGQVGRSIDNRGERLVVKTGADIGGDLRYQSRNELQREPSVSIAGTIQRSQPPRHEGGQGLSGLAAAKSLFFLLAMLVTSLVLVLLVPAAFRRVSGTTLAQTGRVFLVGLVATIVVPLIIVTLMLTVVGLPLGLLLLLVWLLLLLLSGPFAAYAVGRRLVRADRSPVIVMLAGSGIVLILYLIPFVNVLTVAAVVWFGVGSLLLTAWQQRRQAGIAATARDDGMIDDATTSAVSAEERSRKLSKDAKPKTRR